MNDSKSPERIAAYPDNCVLVAFQQALPHLDETDIVHTCKQYGFSGKGGMNIHQWTQAAKVLGIVLNRLPSPHGSMSLAQVTKTLSTGTYLVRTAGHLLCVINGVIVDPNWKGRNGRRKVWSIFEVCNATHKKRTGLLPSNPVIRFLHTPRGACKIGTSTYSRYHQAYFHVGTYRYTDSQGCSTFLSRLNDLTANTDYTRKDFRRDLRRGSIEIIN